MSPEEQTKANEHLFCTFRVDHLFVGVEVWRVQEVIRHQQTTPVPLAVGEVSGLINLRGQIVTTIDMRRWLDLPPRGGDTPPMNAVLRLGEEAVSLLVDEAGDVVAPDPGAFEPVPPTASERIRALFSGTYKLPEHLLLVLDPAALDSLARPRADALGRTA